MKLKPLNNNPATRVFEALRARGVSQALVAEQLGISSSVISKWKAAKDGHSGSVPTEHRVELKAICQKYGVKWRKGDL